VWYRAFSDLGHSIGIALVKDPFGLGDESLARINPSDPAERRAYDRLVAIFDSSPDRVFFSRQLEVALEGDFIHWITNRALRRLAGEGRIETEKRSLRAGGAISLYWSNSFRYYKRTAAQGSVHNFL
jgi:hypothetical protein